MSSNPLYGLQKVGTFVQLTGLPGRPVRQPVCAGCTRRLCGRRLWLVTKSALEVYVVHDDAIYKLTTFTFLPLVRTASMLASWLLRRLRFQEEICYSVSFPIAKCNARFVGIMLYLSVSTILSLHHLLTAYTHTSHHCTQVCIVLVIQCTAF